MLLDGELSADDRALFLDEVVAPKRALLAAFRARHPDAAAAMDEAMRATRERRAARKKSAADLLRRLLALYFRGASLESAAKDLERSAKGLQNLGAARGLPLTWRVGYSRALVEIRSDRAAALGALADDAGATRDDMLRELLALCFDENAHVARRLLKVERRATA